jgi:hypothetical protein
MSPDLSSSPEFQAALELVFDGRREPNGYTETVLHKRRREVKARLRDEEQAAPEGPPESLSGSLSEGRPEANPESRSEDQTVGKTQATQEAGAS